MLSLNNNIYNKYICEEEEWERERAQIWRQANDAGMSLREIARLVGKSHETVRRWIALAGGVSEVRLRPAFPRNTTIPLKQATCDDVHPGLECPADPREVCMINEHHCKTTFTGDSMDARIAKGDDDKAEPTSYVPGELKGGVG